MTGLVVSLGVILANASIALALSAHTPRVQRSVCIADANWRSKLGWDTPKRYLAAAGMPVNHDCC